LMWSSRGGGAAAAAWWPTLDEPLLGRWVRHATEAIRAIFLSRTLLCEIRAVGGFPETHQLMEADGRTLGAALRALSAPVLPRARWYLTRGPLGNRRNGMRADGILNPHCEGSAD